MNPHLMILEFLVAGLALGFLLLDLWTPAAHKRQLGLLAAFSVVGVLAYSFSMEAETVRYAFHFSYVLDPLALYFKRFFLIAAIFVLIIALEYADRIETGVTEYYSIILFALTGMMFASSANNFAVLFVSLELITISFYVLNSFLRTRYSSLEAGVKYLILGAMSTGFTIFGIALVYGATGTMEFKILAEKSAEFAHDPVALLGVLLVLAGLGFKLAAFPFQIWAPDVYQGAPTPSTAFLAIGSKAAGIVLLLRLLFSALPAITQQWSHVLMVVAGITILYGNLCAIPQQNLKRLFGYSSIAHAGYLLLGVAALNREGTAAILFYLGGYLFTVLAAFLVITLVLRVVEAEDISGLAGLNQRSPLLATTLTMAMVSLAGIPPLAGFFGKFLLLKSILVQGEHQQGYYALAFVTLAGVIISLYYYFNVIRAIYWSRQPQDLTPIHVSIFSKAALYVCIAGMLFLGLFPAPVLRAAEMAVRVLKF